MCFNVRTNHRLLLLTFFRPRLDHCCGTSNLATALFDRINRLCVDLLDFEDIENLCIARIMN